MKRIAIFASGSGSNALKILEYFKGKEDAEVALIVANKKDAGVLNHAKKHKVPTLKINRDYFYNTESILQVLKAESVDLIVLAGFLWLIPSYLIDIYPNKIVNIHPALLPKYGGKGMYGIHVHKAVKAAQDRESGITIHFVNKKYDDGAHIFQVKCKLEKDDSPETIAKKVLKLEHKNYAKIVYQLLFDHP